MEYQETNKSYIDEEVITPMPVSLQDKVVCITGSARRVGRAIALEFARNGAHVVIHHHSSDADAITAADEARALGVAALITKADQSNPDDVERMFDEIASHYGRLDVMVNSAANFMQTPLLDISFEEWQQVIGINLSGPWLCTQHAARMMVTSGNGGAIINISDNSALSPWKSRPHHSIAKAGVVMLTRVAALALGEHNIRVNCVIPGPVLRPPDETDESWQRVVSKLPLGRGGDPSDVAQACVFLATGDFVSGTVLNVDGGESTT
jgi:NAD(P)-dependent dehydrogenase (short-subunit alcohol dehydrogenase family)